MNIEFKCPQCGQIVEADESDRGQVAACPHCGKGIVVPKSKANDEVQREATKVVHVRCPHCGTAYEVSRQDMCRRTSCEVCGKSFVMVKTVPVTQAAKAKTATSQANPTPRPRPVIDVGKNACVSSARPPNLTIWIAAGAACMVAMLTFAFVLGRHSGKSDSPAKAVAEMRGDDGDKPMRSESANETIEKSTEVMPLENGADRVKKEEVATAQASNEKSENLPEEAPLENDASKSNNAEHEEVVITTDETETTRHPSSRECVEKDEKDDIQGEADVSMSK